MVFSLWKISIDKPGSWVGPTPNVWDENDCEWLVSITEQAFNDTDKCKSTCSDGNYKTCNAFTYWSKSDMCYFYECPAPVPEPSQKYKDAVGYYLKRDYSKRDI